MHTKWFGIHVVNAEINDLLSSPALGHATFWLISVTKHISLELPRTSWKGTSDGETGAKNRYLFNDVNNEMHHDIKKEWREQHLKLG